MNDSAEEVQVKWRKKDDASADAAGQEMPAASGDEASWEERIREEQARAEDYLSRWQRSQADLANLRRRNQQEREDYIKRANEELIRDLLPVLDSFDGALASMPAHLRELTWIDGIILVDRQLRMALVRHGVTPIEAHDQKFDPTQHEAVTHKMTAEHEDGTITTELRKGYRLHERVLRPSLVEVASNPGSGVADATAQSTVEEK
jgi:molecular chaperone GrpE